MYNIDALHTTPLGQQRIKDNLRLNDEDVKEVVEYCKAAIRQTPATASQLKGKTGMLTVVSSQLLLMLVPILSLLLIKTRK